MNNQPVTGFRFIHQWVENIAQNNPDAIAVNDSSLFSYSQLNSDASGLANTLFENGVRQGDCVGVCLPRSYDLMVAILAILKTGAAYVPFDPEYPADRLNYMADTANVKTMVANQAMKSALPKGNFSIVDVATKSTSSSNLITLDEAKHTAAYVLFTSGSTGKPKGVTMSNAALVNLLNWQSKNSTAGIGDATLQFSPISFDVSFQEIFSTWSTGGTIVLINDEERLNPKLLAEVIESKKITRLFQPFVALQQLMDYADKTNITLTHIREIITAGEQLQITPAIKNFFKRHPNCTLHNHYGPTETHVVTAYQLPKDVEQWVALPPIGTAIDQTELIIVDEQLNPSNEGELLVSGTCLADGYINNQNLTNERFVQHPFDASKRAYKTGDLVRKKDDGNLLYLGRIDGQVKVRGYRIELGEIESALALYPEIQQTAATVREDIPGRKTLVAYYISNNDIPVPQLRKHLNKHLPDYMMPGAFVRMDAFPRTPSGKTDRKALPAPDTRRPDLGIPYQAPSNEVEQNICSIWEELLMIQPIGVLDNFFELGGNSLMALQCISRLQQYGMQVPITAIYKSPTIRTLAFSLTDQQESENLWEAYRQKNDTGSGKNDDIAVIGMAVKFPGANSIEEFWKNLCEGKESITFFTDEQLNEVPAELRIDPSYVKARGIIENADCFDAAFFGLNPNVAKTADPQQRVFLEVAWNALEHSGYSPDRYKKPIGVFAGMGNNTYYQHNVLSNKEIVDRIGSFLNMTWNEKDYIATRVAYEFNLTGPALSIHTGCSTSLVAITLACESLWNKSCDMALAGGAAITSPVNSGQRYEEGAIYSNDGHTRAFDKEAKGTVFSDGVGAVILKRLSDAIADGDTIYATVKGAALNNDGKLKGSFTAPSIEGQSAAITAAQAKAGIKADSISYIETHGTATPLGDPIEVEGLTKAFRYSTDKNQFCAIGSVKTNFGHLTSAAGVAGFIKTVLCLHHKTLVPNLFYNENNPAIDFKSSPFFVNTELKPWKNNNLPLRAGVSSFGVGGTNAHVILEESPVTEKGSSSRPKQLMMISAKSQAALDRNKELLQQSYSSKSLEELADLSYTLQTGRTAMPYRYFKVVDAQEKNNESEIEISKNLFQGNAQLKATPGGIVFLFPGQGSQYVGMGKTLYNDELVYREAVDTCAAILNPLMGLDIRTILFADENDANASELIKQTRYTQPSLFVTGYALAKLWMSWGIKPSAMIGHSIGEFVAATLSGVFSLQDGLTLVATRGKLMQDLPGGSMMSVRLPAADIESQLPNTCSIAAINGAQLCVIAGPENDIEKIRISLEEKEIICKLLHTSHAFHSPMMDPVVKPFTEVVKKIKLNTPQIPIVSTVTTQWLTEKESCDPLYWSGHLRATVKFADAVKQLWTEQPTYVLLECGPRNTASTLARQQATQPGAQKAISSLGDSNQNNSEWNNILQAVGQLWLTGIEIDWNAFYVYEKRKHVAGPLYSFEKTSYWLTPQQQQPMMMQSYFNTQPLQQINLPLQQETTMTTDRKPHLQNELRTLLEDASGMELQHAPIDSNFIELGLDSLLLTQVALSLTRKYGVKITFRQLNEELSSIGAISEFLDQQLPADAINAAAPSSPQPQAQPILTAMPAANADMSMQQLMMQQLQLMQQQIMNMSNGQQVQQPVAQAIQPTIADKNLSISKEELTEIKKPFGAIARIEKKSTEQFTPEQEKWLKEFIARYVKQTEKSKAYTQQHRAHLADPRVVTGFKPHLKEITYQPVVNKSKGSRIWDIDGNEYIDILNGFGSNMFGHSPQFIVDAIQKQMEAGYEIGPQHDLAGEVAEKICKMTGSDRAGLCNTGSEAVLGALRIARTVTGKTLVACFNGSYHGINDEVIVRGTKKLKSFPASAGVPDNAVESMLVVDYGTDEAFEILKQRSGELAAILVEPIQSRRSDFQPTEFIKKLRTLCTEKGILLIFDEVITGFRTYPGGAQEYYGIKADLGTYGKVVGGGMPIGVIAGKREYMDALDGGHWEFGNDSTPDIGVTYFAGTFVRHPFALAAAKASLDHMIAKGPALQQQLNNLTERLANEVNAYCKESGVPLKLAHFGSLFKVKYEHEFANAELIYPLMRLKGIHMYDGFPCFLTEAHTNDDVTKIIEAFKSTLAELISLGLIPGKSKLVATTSNHLNGSAKTAVDSTSATHEADDQFVNPPVPGARLGKDPQGNPGWYIPDPNEPGKFLKYKTNNQ
jgi:amino acid adenylation domain-containing protein